jgi:peroxin-12
MDFKTKAAYVFFRVYPVIKAAKAIAECMYQIGYLYDESRYYSPWLHWMGVEYDRFSEEDYVSVLLSLSCVLSHLLRHSKTDPTSRSQMILPQVL